MARPFGFASLTWPPTAGQWKVLADTLEDIYRRLREGLDGTTTLTGDVTGEGTTDISTTLASVNSNVGTFGSDTLVPVITVDAKGRVTAVTEEAVSGGAIDATDIADGTVTNTEFQYINTVTSNVQTQLDAKTGVPWSGHIAGAYEDGNPNRMLALLNRMYNPTTPTNPTPTNITTSVARISYFVLPFDLTVNKLRYFSVGTVASAYSVAIYRFSDLARLTAQIDFDTPGVSQWAAAGSSLNLSLVKDTAYFLAVSVRATGGTAGVMSFTASSDATRPMALVLPSAGAGNLAIGSNYVGGGQLGQFAVTTGALPTTAATLAVQGVWTGGMPGFFLDNSNA